MTPRDNQRKKTPLADLCRRVELNIHWLTPNVWCNFNYLLGTIIVGPSSKAALLSLLLRSNSGELWWLFDHSGWWRNEIQATKKLWLVVIVVITTMAPAAAGRTTAASIHAQFWGALSRDTSGVTFDKWISKNVKLYIFTDPSEKSQHWERQCCAFFRMFSIQCAFIIWNGE